MAWRWALSRGNLYNYLADSNSIHASNSNVLFFHQLATVSNSHGEVSRQTVTMEDSFLLFFMPSPQRMNNVLIEPCDESLFLYYQGQGLVFFVCTLFISFYFCM